MPVKVESSSSPSTSATNVEYSSTATRRALCVGIHYARNNSSKGFVPGAHSDVRRMSTFLKSKGFEVVTMLDDSPQGPLPTKDNIRMAIQQLTMNTKQGDRLFFFFAGHGTQIQNEDGEEFDDLDEVILPSDAIEDNRYPEYDRHHWDANTIIIDNDLHDWLIRPLPSGAYLTVVLDSCNSGTAMDLKFVRSYDISASGQHWYPWSNGSSPLPRDNDIMSRQVRGRHPIMRGSSLDNLQLQPEPLDGPTVFCWSACPDGEKSYGIEDGGLFTTAWIHCFVNHSHVRLTVQEALTDIHHYLEDKAKAINARRRKCGKSLYMIHTPQFSSHRRVNMDDLIEDFL